MPPRSAAGKKKLVQKRLVDAQTSVRLALKPVPKLKEVTIKPEEKGAAILDEAASQHGIPKRLVRGPHYIKMSTDDRIIGPERVRENERVHALLQKFHRNPKIGKSIGIQAEEWFAGQSQYTSGYKWVKPQVSKPGPRWDFNANNGDAIEVKTNTLTSPDLTIGHKGFANVEFTPTQVNCIQQRTVGRTKYSLPRSMKWVVIQFYQAPADGKLVWMRHVHMIEHDYRKVIC